MLTNDIFFFQKRKSSTFKTSNIATTSYIIETYADEQSRQGLQVKTLPLILLILLILSLIVSTWCCRSKIKPYIQIFKNKGKRLTLIFVFYAWKERIFYITKFRISIIKCTQALLSLYFDLINNILYFWNWLWWYGTPSYCNVLFIEINNIIKCNLINSFLRKMFTLQRSAVGRGFNTNM